MACITVVCELAVAVAAGAALFDAVSTAWDVTLEVETLVAAPEAAASGSAATA